MDELVSPAAPMSWMPTARPDSISSRVASSRSFLVKGSPIWTEGRLADDASDSSSEAKVAPWMPSRPVVAPTAITRLPGPEAKPRMIFLFSTSPRHITLTNGLVV